MKLQHIYGVPPLYTNTFLIITKEKHGIIIDAAAEPATYQKALEEAGAELSHILLTHGHYDHVGAVAALKKATGCKVYMDPADAAGSQLLPLTPDAITDTWPANDELTIDELTFKIYHTPGHTPGGVCLWGAVQRGYAVCRFLRAHGFPRRQHAPDAAEPLSAGGAAPAR